MAGVTADALPDPNLPDPNLPDPNLPDPNLPDPNLPDPNLPDPNLPDHSLDDEHSPGRTAPTLAATRPRGTLAAAGELLRALSAPVRIAIVLQLRDHERCVHELVDALGVTQPLISQHLRVLKSAGVVDGERHGREVVYRLVDEHLSHIVVDAVTHVEEE